MTLRSARADTDPNAPVDDTSLSPAPATPATVPAAPRLMGYHDGHFFLRDEDDNYRLYFQGRVHVDSVTSFGPGLGSLPPDQALKSSIYLRRVRLELAGELLQHFQWQLSAEFASNSADNVGARNAGLDCPVDPTTGAENCSSRTSAVEAPSVKPIPTDAFLNYAANPWVNLQGGQFFIPFTYENRVTDNNTPFLERSTTVRNLGAPTIRDIGVMFWGEAPNGVVQYNIGIFDGDGQNRMNADNRYDVIGRAYVRPFAAGTSRHPLEGLQLGASGRYGSRDRNYVGYDMPTLTTQGGYGFWKPTYKDSGNNLVHILPSGDQIGVAADLNLPISIFDVTSEVVYAKSNTREALDGYVLSPFTERVGALKGYSYYVQVGAWLFGSRDVIGFPSYAKPVHVDLTKPSSPPEYALEILAKVEQLHLSYDGASRGGVSDSKTPNGDIDTSTFSVGLNFWATRHVRLSINYVYNVFPDSAPVSATTKGGPVQSSEQRALAPAQNLVKGTDDTARDTGHDVHEVMTRVAVQF